MIVHIVSHELSIQREKCLLLILHLIAFGEILSPGKAINKSLKARYFFLRKNIVSSWSNHFLQLLAAIRSEVIERSAWTVQYPVRFTLYKELNHVIAFFNLDSDNSSSFFLNDFRWLLKVRGELLYLNYCV